MAREYVSCPVEQPADQMRMVSGFFRISAGNTSRWSASNTAGSRKKLVTVMSRFSYNACDSGRFFSRYDAYSARSVWECTAMRRRIRRRIVVSR